MLKSSLHTLFFVRVIIIIYLSVNGMLALDINPWHMEGPNNFLELSEKSEKETSSEETKKIKEVDEFDKQCFMVQYRIKNSIGNIVDGHFNKLTPHFKEIPTPPPEA